eukprot:1051765-Prymnesium_polylepis.1
MRAAGSCERGRGGRRLAAAVQTRSYGERVGWQAGRAGLGAGSKEALRGGGCRRRAPAPAAAKTGVLSGLQLERRRRRK